MSGMGRLPKLRDRFQYPEVLPDALLVDLPNPDEHLSPFPTVRNERWKLVLKRSGCPWNKGKLVGEVALKAKEIWRFGSGCNWNMHRDLALFNLGSTASCAAATCDAPRSGCCPGRFAFARAIVMQQKTKRPVKFEITEQTRDAVGDGWRKQGFAATTSCSQAGSLRPRTSPHGNTPRILKSWVAAVGLDPTGTARIRCAGPRPH